MDFATEIAGREPRIRHCDRYSRRRGNSAKQVQPAHGLQSIHGPGADGDAPDDAMRSQLPALNIVAEKEAGTIEQINVTPVGQIDASSSRATDPLLVDRILRPDTLLRPRPAFLRTGTGRKHRHYLRGCRAFRTDHLGLRPHDFEPFRHDAAGDLRDDVFHGDPDSAQRPVHSNQQYAAVGAGHYNPQPPEVPDAGEAAGLPRRESLLATYSTVRSAGHTSPLS